MLLDSICKPVRIWFVQSQIVENLMKQRRISRAIIVARSSQFSPDEFFSVCQDLGGDRIRLDHARSGLRVVVDQLAT